MVSSAEMRLLIVNPNTSTDITDSLKPFIARLDLPGISVSYFTSQLGAPVLASLDDINSSTSHTLGPLLELADQYDGLLIACYADHPLTKLLQLGLAPTPVVGIFEASVFTAINLLSAIPTAKFGIITTGQYYESQLTQGVHRILSGEGEKCTRLTFAGVVSTGISPEKLKIETPSRIRRRIEQATRRLLAAGDIEVICVGGVILAGMEDWIREACVTELGADRGESVIVVDQMEAGLNTLKDCFENGNSKRFRE